LSGDAGGFGARLSAWPAGWPEPVLNGAGAAVRFGVLGPLEVVDGAGAGRAVPAAKQRIVLATLLLAGGRTVPAPGLAEALWDTSPPPNAPAVMRTYVMRLRRVLGPAGGRIVRRPAGWAVELHDPQEFDLALADCLGRDAQVAAQAQNWRQVSSLLATALSLWRGEPLADVPSAALARREAGRLAELRLQFTQARIDADLHAGRHGDVVAELRRLAAEHPFREHIRAQLMLACYRCGHQAAALAVYREARRALADELGVEPGHELRQLHQMMLIADPSLLPGPAAFRWPAPGELPAAPAQFAGTGAAAAPRELPGAVRHFVGREEELAALTALLTSATRPPATLVISAIGGTAGVGKTALALRWAQQAAELFPDGQLYVNLRGYDPGRPVDAGEALAGFLRAMGVAGQDIPADADERAARYRSLLAGRKLLIMLDNASDVSQVRPLLPGTPGCVTLVTSRNSLAGLVAREGAHRLDLDLLPLPDAVGLLRAMIGARVDAEPASAAKLAEQAARLPLALRVAAELAVARPGVSLADLTAELADQRRRLDLLEAGGDAGTTVRAVFSWSYRQLDDAAARAFRLAGLHPGADFDRYALAALTGTTVADADRMLDVLARAYLLQAAGPGRYGLHDLLRAYARELAGSGEDDQDRRAALSRLFGYYLRAAQAATAAIFPAEASRAIGGSPSPDGPSPPIADETTALAWLDAERANLVTTAGHAAEHGWSGLAIGLAVTLFRYLDAAGHFTEAITIHSCARRAAARAGDRAAEGTALTNLGVVHIRQGQDRQAAECLRHALRLHRQTGDRTGEARTLHNLGVIEIWHGEHRQAAGYLGQALRLHRQAGDLPGQIRSLSTLGCIDRRLGRYPQATGRQQEALALSRRIGDRTGEAYALAYLGELDSRQDRYQQADDQIRSALTIFRELGDRNGQAGALNDLADLDLHLGRHEQAAAHLQQALILHRQLGDRNGEAEALNVLGELLLVTGQNAPGRTQHEAALTLASSVGNKYQQARAHDGLARSYHADHDTAIARRHWEEALSLYTGLDIPEADQIRSRLAACAESGWDRIPNGGRTGR
jgi:DNA-binding SARP family transcriptional activator